MKSVLGMFGMVFMILAPNAGAEEEVMAILSYQADPMTVLNAEAEFVKTIKVENLPKPDVVVDEYNEAMDLVRITDSQGNSMWFDTFDVKLNKGKVVTLDCEVLTKLAPQDQKETGTMGFGSRCNK